jgi:large subunit ribosomal protein L19
VVSSTEIALRDPTGARTRLFDTSNPDCVNVGDIILVRQRTGEPFAGVVIRLLRKGVDTSVLLRNTMTGVGVEMEFKVYSPNVTSIELVKRRDKVPKQNVLYYLRKPEHDPGSLENIVRQYLRQRSAGTTTRQGVNKGRRK